MNTSIRAFSLTIRELVTQFFKTDVNLRDFFDPLRGGTMVVSLLAPEELAASAEGVSLWLYRIERDNETLNAPPRRSAKDKLLHQPLPLRLHYLIVPVVDISQRLDGPELEQNILGAVLQCFHDHATLRGAVLQGDLAGSKQEFHMRLESLDLDQMSRMWEALSHAFQLGVSYEATAIPIDSSFQPETAPPVDVSLPEYGLISAEEST
jgi:Pvc16 N-terminal domain